MTVHDRFVTNEAFMAELIQERMRTRVEVADLLGVSEQTLRDWERAGRGPEVIRFSPKVARYPAAAIARFFEASNRGVPAELEARR